LRLPAPPASPGDLNGGRTAGQHGGAAAVVPPVEIDLP
jgi:hypothetical protein